MLRIAKVVNDCAKIANSDVCKQTPGEMALSPVASEIVGNDTADALSCSWNKFLSYLDLVFFTSM